MSETCTWASATAQRWEVWWSGAFLLDMALHTEDYWRWPKEQRDLLLRAVLMIPPRVRRIAEARR